MTTDVASPMAIQDASVFKEAMSRFPSGVVIATTRDGNGKSWGFTASSFSSVSLDPPLVMVCLAKGAECYQTFVSAQRFAISVLPANEQSLATRFSKRGADKFAGLKVDFDAHGSPLLPGAIAVLTCRRFNVYDCGDHSILVGQVLTTRLGSDDKALVYCGRSFGRFAAALDESVRKELKAILSGSLAQDDDQQIQPRRGATRNQRAAQAIRHCIRCGSDVVSRVPQGDTLNRHICSQCGNVHYVNPTVVVGCIAEAADGRILMCKRRISPRRGYWTFPSGFLECGESGAAGACREALEEAQADVQIRGLLCVMDVPQISELHLIYRAVLRDSPLVPTAESSEVTLIAEADIPWNQLAFTSIGESLRHYFEDRRSNQTRVHTVDLHTALRSENGD